MKKAVKIIFGFLAIVVMAGGISAVFFLDNKIEIINKIESASVESSTYESSYKPSSVIETLFVGDIMLDRGVAEHAEKSGADSLFSAVNDLFFGKDLIVGNLEGTMTDNDSIAKKNNSILRFTFDPSYAELLKKYGFSVLSLANNHTLDFGRDGYTQTVNNLRDASLSVFGSPENDENVSTKISVRGKTFCLVGYHDLFTLDPTPALTEIKNIRADCSYVILFAHWGVEYEQTATQRQRMLAHQFIDAGADLVIGAHPHVVEPIEVYKNKAIFYSLGNFIFDQRLSFETEHGLTVDVKWDDERTVFTLIPTAIQDYEVGVASPEDAEKVVSEALGQNLLGEALASAIINTKQFILWNSK